MAPLLEGQAACSSRVAQAPASRGLHGGRGCAWLRLATKVHLHRAADVVLQTSKLTVPAAVCGQTKAVPVQQTTELSFLQTSNFVDQIYLYAGLAVDNKHETGFIAKEIRKHNYQTMVRLFTSLDDATFRAVLWDQSVHCLVIIATIAAAWNPWYLCQKNSDRMRKDSRSVRIAVAAEETK